MLEDKLPHVPVMLGPCLRKAGIHCSLTFKFNWVSCVWLSLATSHPHSILSPLAAPLCECDATLPQQPPHYPAAPEFSDCLPSGLNSWGQLSQCCLHPWVPVAGWPPVTAFCHP